MNDNLEENDEIQILGIELEIENLYRNCQYIVNDNEIYSDDEVDKNLVVGYGILNEKAQSHQKI
jgi:hypothetical protein